MDKVYLHFLFWPITKTTLLSEKFDFYGVTLTSFLTHLWLTWCKIKFSRIFYHSRDHVVSQNIFLSLNNGGRELEDVEELLWLQRAIYRKNLSLSYNLFPEMITRMFSLFSRSFHLDLLPCMYLLWLLLNFSSRLCEIDSLNGFQLHFSLRIWSFWISNISPMFLSFLCYSFETLISLGSICGRSDPKFTHLTLIFLSLSLGK